jgi:hypothetical protein
MYRSKVGVFLLWNRVQHFLAGIKISLNIVVKDFECSSSAEFLSMRGLLNVGYSLGGHCKTGQ